MARGSQVIPEHGGYRVVTAANGAEAAARFAARADEFALVVSDRDMPILGGAGLARLIRARGAMIKVLEISGLGGDPPTSGVRETFGDAFLHKPFAVDALLKIVGQLLPRPRATDQPQGPVGR